MVIPWFYSGYADVPVYARPCQKDCVIPVTLAGYLSLFLPKTEFFEVGFLWGWHTESMLEVNWSGRKCKIYSLLSPETNAFSAPAPWLPRSPISMEKSWPRVWWLSWSSTESTSISVMFRITLDGVKEWKHCQRYNGPKALCTFTHSTERIKCLHLWQIHVTLPFFRVSILTNNLEK